MERERDEDGRMAPIKLQFLIACQVYACPSSSLGHEYWDSPAGRATRSWLLKEDLVDTASQITDRGRVFLDAIRSLPLPVSKTVWSMPDQAEGRCD